MLLLEIIPTKKIEHFSFSQKMDLHEESGGLVGIGKAQRLMHKYSSVPFAL